MPGLRTLPRQRLPQKARGDPGRPWQVRKQALSGKPALVPVTFSAGPAGLCRAVVRAVCPTTGWVRS
eukprot:4645313-Alexandrium_andersonii.AAC.1